jgi:hypothetical protein
MYGVQKGLGFADTQACNWVDEFGECVTPLPGNTIVTSGGTRLQIGGTASSSTSTSFTQWLNKNGMYVGIGLAAVLLLGAVGGRRR